MTVTVYSKPRCVSCTATYRDLTRRGIEFTTVDVTQDEQAMSDIKALGYLQAPVVVAGDEHWSGYQEDKIDELEKAIKGTVAA